MNSRELTIPKLGRGQSLTCIGLPRLSLLDPWFLRGVPMWTYPALLTAINEEGLITDSYRWINY